MSIELWLLTIIGVSQEIAIVKIENIIESLTPNNCQSSTETKVSKPIDNRTIDNCDKVNIALERTADLISEQFKPWYAKQAYRIGPDRYLGIASDARRGKNPAKLFSFLLRRTV